MTPVTIDEYTHQKLILASLAILKDYGYFTQCMWHVSDIHLLCEQRRWPSLSHAEAKEVFDIFVELYEGDQGLTWAKLEQATQVYLVKYGKITMPAERTMCVERIKEKESEPEFEN